VVVIVAVVVAEAVEIMVMEKEAGEEIATAIEAVTNVVRGQGKTTTIVIQGDEYYKMFQPFALIGSYNTELCRCSSRASSAPGLDSIRHSGISYHFYIQRPLSRNQLSDLWVSQIQELFCMH